MGAGRRVRAVSPAADRRAERPDGLAQRYRPRQPVLVNRDPDQGRLAAEVLRSVTPGDGPRALRVTGVVEHAPITDPRAPTLVGGEEDDSPVREAVCHVHLLHEPAP